MEYEDDFESQFAEELEVIREQEKGEYSTSNRGFSLGWSGQRLREGMV